MQCEHCITLGVYNGFMDKTMFKTAWILLALRPLLALAPQLRRPCCAYLLLSHLEVLLEIKDVGRMWHNRVDEILPTDNNPAKSKVTGCCYVVLDQWQPCCTELVAREVVLMGSQLRMVCPFPWAAYLEMPACTFCCSADCFPWE